jgi:hypothetical protein
MIEIDGSRYSGSGTIVRQAVTFAALTGQAVHLVKARVRRPKPGCVHSISVSSKPFARWWVDRPKGSSRVRRPSSFGLGRHGAMLALAVLPVLTFRRTLSLVE